jgi:hypothetical protein
MPVAARLSEEACEACALLYRAVRMLRMIVTSFFIVFLVMF